MRRRLDLALALVHEPAVLFLDEPTTGLDPMSRVALWEEVHSLNQERGTTVFLTTQYLEEADRLAGRIAIIDHGRIVREGAPAALKAQVGVPTLNIVVPDGCEEKAATVLARFGESVPARAGHIAVRLPGGASELPAVVRALDEAGVTAEAMEITAPSLDDVFADATGRRLEGADEAADAGLEPSK
jgi:ABC-2 type transport system ATP-binding protein